MEKAELQILIRQLGDLMAGISRQLMQIKEEGKAVPSILIELIAWQIHTEKLLRGLLKVYVEGDPLLTELLEKRFFEIELSRLLEETQVLQ